MLRNIFLVSLLIYAACATHLEIREVNSAEDQDEEISADGLLEQQIPVPICPLCKIIVLAVQKALSHKPTLDEIKTKLSKACDIFRSRKMKCKDMIETYMNKLIDHITKNEAPTAVCTKIHICSEIKTIKKFVFADE